MRELIYDNVRIQFLSEEVLRLEVRYGAYFTDRNTLWIPDRGAFEKAGKRLPESQSRSRENQGRQQSMVVREEAAQEHSRPQRFLLGDLLLVLPNPREGLRGLQIFREGKCVYQYERVKINGKLPAPAQTPWIYPLLDVPRILLPEKNCSTSEKKKYILQWDAEDLYLLVCKKDARKLRETYVCLTGRADMLREAVLEDQKIEPCLKQPLRLLKAASDGKSEAETPANGLYTEILENPERYFQDRKKELPYLDYLEMTECQRQTNLKQMLRKPGNDSLLPMLYRNVYESWENGMPICRRLDWEYPQDKKVLLYLQEFMIGDLLVVPEKEKSEIYLPEGLWLYPWTGKVYQGKRCRKLKNQSEQLELYIRLGAVLILAEDTACVKEQSWELLTMDYYPCKECLQDGFLYEDDRETDAYKNGKYRKTYYHTSYDGNQKAYGLSISNAEGDFGGRFAGKRRTLRIRCHELLGERVKQVLINGRKQTFERILKSKAAKVFGTAGAAPDSDVAELVVEHPLSECLHVDFVME